ncbi:hypothetical protein CsSME_00047034 [Camellia sinensis var. sinensis]
MFVADVKRMFGNARTYNSPETIYYKYFFIFTFLIIFFTLILLHGYYTHQEEDERLLETHFFGKVQSGVQSGLKIQH